MKKAVVDQAKCIGCATCVGIASQSFKIDKATGKAVPIYPAGDDQEVVETAVSACPVEAISLVAEDDSGSPAA